MSRRNDPRESTLVRQIVTALRDIPGVAVRKRHGSVLGFAGDPDVYGSIRGRHFELEVKRPGKHPTPLQEMRLAQWRASGAIAGVVHEVSQALTLLGVEEK